jgi:hypothetical protein
MVSLRSLALVASCVLVVACGNPVEQEDGPPADGSGNETNSMVVSTSSASETSSGVPISYAKDVEPIFLTSCAICHAPGGTGVNAPDTDLDLSAGVGYTSLKNQVSVTTGTKFIGPTLESSYLWAKVEGTEPPFGSTMPLGSVLFGDQLTLVMQWLETGAAP